MDLTLSAIFAAGMLTALSPCVLPVAPIIVAGLVGDDTASRARRLAVTLWFVLGFGIVFVLLGLGVSVMAEFARPLRPVLLGGAAVVLALFGLRMMHVLDGRRGFDWLHRSITPPQPASGPGTPPGGIRALVFGATFGLAWTPCAGPILGGVLTYVAAADAAPGPAALMLASYAGGVAVPLVLASVAAGYVTSALRRIGPLARRLEFATGTALTALAVVLLVQIPEGRGAATGDAATATTRTTRSLALDASAGHRLLYFHSSTCPACQAMEAYLPGLERSCRDAGWALVRVDVDRAESVPLLERFGVRAVPTMTLLDVHGDELQRLVGYQPETGLRQTLQDGFGVHCTDAAHPAGAEPLDAEPCAVGNVCG